MDGTYRIFPGVEIGEGSVVEDYCILGALPRGKKAGELKTSLGRGAILRSHTVIYAGNRIGDNFQTGNKVNIRESNEIGSNVSVGTLSVIEHHVRIGNNVRMHSQVFVPEFTVIEDDAWLAPSVVITNAKYPLSKDVKETLAGPIIRRGAKIGANATILPGIVIGMNSLVGAGSVVTKDVPDNAVVAGTPAKLIKMITTLPY